MGKSFLRTLAVPAGITKNLTPHVFRHTFISNLRASGFSSYEIQSLTGHRNVATLEGYGVNAPQGLGQKIEGAFHALDAQRPEMPQMASVLILTQVERHIPALEDRDPIPIDIKENSIQTKTQT
jgi:hypothetical protein